MMGKVKHTIPGQIRERLLRKPQNSETTEIQTFFRPLKNDSGNIVDWVQVGEHVCTKKLCESMYNSCSSCHANATQKAEARLAQALLENKPKSSEPVAAKGSLVIPEGLTKK